MSAAGYRRPAATTRCTATWIRHPSPAAPTPSTATGGDDQIFGGNGNDVILGDNGNDSIYGFDIRAGDNDVIDLRPLFDALGYSGTVPRTDGFLRVQQSGADALVQIDADGNTNGASFVTLVTLVERTAGDIGDGFFLFSSAETGRGYLDPQRRVDVPLGRGVLESCARMSDVRHLELQECRDPLVDGLNGPALAA